MNIDMAALHAIEADKGSQVVVLMVPTTLPEDIAGYANRVANEWKIGRKAVGDGVRLMVDVNQKLDVLGNIRQAQALEDLDLVWYEEPVLADDFAACAEVARSIKIPVATGENAYSRFEFRELIERRAARYLMPNVGRANGYSETLRIGHLAAAHGLPVTPHVVHELSLHVVGALANGFLVIGMIRCL